MEILDLAGDAHRKKTGRRRLLPPSRVAWVMKTHRDDAVREWIKSIRTPV